MLSPATSVLMPVFNAESTLEDSVGSVLAQTRTDWELLLIDDGSTDRSPELAARLSAQDSRIRFIRPGGNHGAAAARNTGLEQARGRYIAFLDADDRWYPEKLARQLEFMAQKQAAISFTSYDRATPDGRLLKREIALPVLDYNAMLGPNRMGCLTVIYDTRLCGKQPMPRLPLQQDYALWLKLARLAGPAYGLDVPLACYRVGRGTLSASKTSAVRDIWKVWRQEEKLSLTTSLRAFSRYVRYSLRHRVLQRMSRRVS